MKSKMPENVFEAQLLEMAGAAGGEKVCLSFLKLWHYEKAKKFEKISHFFLTKQLLSHISVKSSGRFFQIFVTFSEKLESIFFGFFWDGHFSKQFKLNSFIDGAADCWQNQTWISLV